MAEWIYEDGIGERRAALIAGGQIIAARIERDSDGARAGATLPATLLPGDGTPLRRVRLAAGEEAMLSALPPRTSDGAALLVTITRSAIPENGLVKRARCRAAEGDAAPGDGADLLAQISASGDALVRTLHPHQRDTLEEAGWSELLDSAANGLIAFPGGLLRLCLTPAMAVFDIDGNLPARELALAGALAAAQAIERLAISGSIVIDFPTLASKAERVAIADVIDAALPQPFERTAVNGYGLMQIIIRRRSPSLPERMQFAKVESAALAMLRRAERARGAAAMTLNAHPAITGWLEARPALITALERRSGRPVRLHADQSQAIGAGDVR